MSQVSARTVSSNATESNVHRIGVAEVEPQSTGRVQEALERARTRIAPLWPLESFVAVNPFLGSTGQPFEEAAQSLRKTTGANLLMPRQYYRELFADSRISKQDLAEALESARDLPDAPKSVEDLIASLDETPDYREAVFKSAAEVLDATHGTEHRLLLVQEIAKWCAAYWDDGQSAWRMPWRNQSLYPAWRSAAEIDRTADAMGLEGFREVVGSLPSDPVETIEHVVTTLGVTDEVLDGYFHRALFSVQGWAGYARYLGWHAELGGTPNDTVLELLAIRLAWDYALFELQEDGAFRDAWKHAVAAMEAANAAGTLDRALTVDAILQAAFDAGYRRDLLAQIESQGAVQDDEARKALHAAFCIDVRSEVFRRALERTSPDVGTTGFAGFFGVPIEVVPIGQKHGAAQCPVLLEPKFVVRERVAGVDEAEDTEILGLRLLRRRAATAWKSFKSSAVSSFVYVETAGLAYAGKLVGDAFGMTRPVKDPNTDGLDSKTVQRIAPDVSPGTMGGRVTGLTFADRVGLAEGMLRAMSMTEGFARLVMLTGHGSTTVNNPHASSYHCGACGGNPGHSNARVAAEILNDEDVRKGLRERGIEIPSDTWFLGALHDTTTDEVTIYDACAVPESHAEGVREAKAWLKDASEMARLERAGTLKVEGPTASKDVISRSQDWSQVRPEWGLARNAAFIAAPRSRTQALDLEGRAFLHDYTWREDEDFSILELILTAPVVVASWINLQYYGSAVDRGTFGSGNKTLHNVVGTLGVLEGNGGDLRVGLPVQAVHDGADLYHEPLRLNVILEAPTAAIDAVLAKHPNVQELVDNGWIHLIALDDEGAACRRDPQTRLWGMVQTQAPS